MRKTIWGTARTSELSQTAAVTGDGTVTGHILGTPEWFLAEGATGPFFDLYVLVANASDAAA